jgi:LacI family transcriptional regulator
LPQITPSDRRGTLKHLAEELNLSITTVSRALGGFDDVAEVTRRRVRDAANRANYVPNAAGKMLVTGQSGFIGLLLPVRDAHFLDPFLGEFILGLSEGLHARGKDLFMATAPGKTELDVLKHVVESGRADAMVLMRIAENDERVAYLNDRGFPFVTHGRTLGSHLRYNWIDTDGEQAFAQAFRLLHGLGHKRMALLSITEPMTFRYFRERGLELALELCSDTDVTLSTHHVPRFNKPEIMSTINTMLRAHDRPTAVIALTDEIALSVLEQASKMGIRVPEDLSVIGFDNIPAAEFAPPGLTTFDQHIRQSAECLAVVIDDALVGNENAQQELVKPTLIKRGSHGPVPT